MPYKEGHYLRSFQRSLFFDSVNFLIVKSGARFWFKFLNACGVTASLASSDQCNIRCGNQVTAAFVVQPVTDSQEWRKTLWDLDDTVLLLFLKT